MNDVSTRSTVPNDLLLDTTWEPFYSPKKRKKKKVNAGHMGELCGSQNTGSYRRKQTIGGIRHVMVRLGRTA